MTKTEKMQKELDTIKARYSRDVGVWIAIAGIFCLATSKLAAAVFITIGLLEMFIGGKEPKDKQP